MTPAQEAKEFAATHDFVIRPVDRRYNITTGAGTFVAEVGGYPAALNAMKRWVEDHKTDIVTVSVVDAAGTYAVVRVERGELEKARVAGGDVRIIPGWDKVDTSTELLDVPGITFGVLEDVPPNPDITCKDLTNDFVEFVDKVLHANGVPPLEVTFGNAFAGKLRDLTSDEIDEVVNILRDNPPVPIATGASLDELAARGPAQTQPKWCVWQRSPGNEGRWHRLIACANRAEAVKFCRQVANGRAALRKLVREIRYEA